MTVSHARPRDFERRLGGVGYEEYHPYGSTAWWAGTSATVSQKRYRYTGMERDEETGLQCHGVRYYAPWLGRWASADPIGLAGGRNLFSYAGAAPTSVSDRSGLEPRAPEIDAAPAAPSGPVSLHITELEEGPYRDATGSYVHGVTNVAGVDIQVSLTERDGKWHAEAVGMAVQVVWWESVRSTGDAAADIDSPVILDLEEGIRSGVVDKDSWIGVLKEFRTAMYDSSWGYSVGTENQTRRHERRHMDQILQRTKLAFGLEVRPAVKSIELGEVASVSREEAEARLSSSKAKLEADATTKLQTYLVTSSKALELQAHLHDEEVYDTISAARNLITHAIAQSWVSKEHGDQLLAEFVKSAPAEREAHWRRVYGN